MQFGFIWCSISSPQDSYFLFKKKQPKNPEFLVKLLAYTTLNWKRQCVLDILSQETFDHPFISNHLKQCNSRSSDIRWIQ